jgi:hypothetical protein
VSHLMLWFLDAPDPSGVRLFAEKVRPALGLGNDDGSPQRHRGRRGSGRGYLCHSERSEESAPTASRVSNGRRTPV